MKCAIFFFSGTGNTKASAAELSKRLQEEGIPADLFAMEEITLGKISFDIRRYDLFGFGFPSHAYDAPQICYRFIDHFLPPIHNHPAFIFQAHAGGPADFGKFRRRIAKKGYHSFYELHFLTPANIAVHRNDTEKRNIALKVSEECKIAAKEIAEKQEHLIRDFWTMLWRFLFSGLEKFGAKRSSKRFRVSKDCFGCLLCATKCPTENISIIDEMPVYNQKKCEMCMRCVYSCPVQAIKAPFPFSVVQIKEKWTNFDNFF